MMEQTARPSSSHRCSVGLNCRLHTSHSLSTPKDRKHFLRNVWRFVFLMIKTGLILWRCGIVTVVAAGADNQVQESHNTEFKSQMQNNVFGFGRRFSELIMGETHILNSVILNLFCAECQNTFPYSSIKRIGNNS